MINLGVNSLERGSQILEIEAAVLRVMEKVKFHPKEIDTELTDAKEEGHLVMVFVMSEVTDQELSNLRRELGDKFTIRILGKSKTDIFVQLQAPKEEFEKLGRRYEYREPQQPVQSRPTYETTKS